jgi:hypothetical protein
MRFLKIVAGLILAASLAACNDEVIDPCEVNPTSTGIFGQCVEADGELCDDDPCDADDFIDMDSHPTGKPTPKVTGKPTPEVTRKPTPKVSWPAVRASTRTRR